MSSTNGSSKDIYIARMNALTNAVSFVNAHPDIYFTSESSGVDLVIQFASSWVNWILQLPSYDRPESPAPAKPTWAELQISEMESEDTDLSDEADLPFWQSRPGEPMSEKQRGYIVGLLRRKGYRIPPRFDELSFDQAHDMIEMLKSKPDKKSR